MNDSNMKMELNEFVGLKTPCDEKIDCNMENMPIAMAYVPWQQWRMIYEPKEALKRGTIFKELDLPFEASKGCK
ncbi:MAG: spore coat associated protein CotJA [Cellulosilyticum sp.]|nr:spore coat associated protein CotJA [Cellulosilyticum sp.]